MSLIKWRLMLTTLPVVAAVVAVKLLTEQGFALPGWVDFSDVSAVLAAGAFLMNVHFLAMDRAGATAHANRSIVFMNAVRRAIGRIEVVSRTGFLPTGYAILEVMVVAILMLLLASRFKTPVAEYALIPSITLIYVYMLRLIRDLDDPFEYRADLVRKGAAEVELFPIVEFVERGSARIAAAAGARIVQETQTA